MKQEGLPPWDLSNVYPGLDSDEFQAAMAGMAHQLDELDRYLSTHKIGRDGPCPEKAAEGAAIIHGYLERMNRALRLGSTLRSYLHSFVSTDSFNNMARRLVSELEPQWVRLQRQEVRFRGWLGTVAEKGDLLARAIQADGLVQDHAFFLEETAEQSRYLMEEAQETLAAELSLSGGNAWQKLHGVITSQLKTPFERDGKLEALPITVIQNLRHDPDGDVRRRAYEAELAAWAGVREPLAACLNGVKGEVNTLNQRRGRTDALDEPLDQARIDRGTLAAMLGAMHDSFPAFRRYWQAKARLLGKELLPWWDLFAPSANSTRRFGYREAGEFIVGQLGGFSERLAAFVERAMMHNWIDAEPREGKRGGAFCMGLLSVEESRILCNFDGSLDQVLTLAHELGHAYHNECQVGKEPLQRRTPMTLAETASIFSETIVTDALLTRAASREEELAILETFLTGAGQVVVDIYSRFLFEREVFQQRAKAELSADELGEIMVRAQRETYGDGLDPHTHNPYMWAWKPHYYRPGLSFYNFPYAFGLLFGLGLYAVYQQRGPAFLPEYDALLRDTGDGTAAELAARFGIDIRQRAFWADSLAQIERRINRYQDLAENGRPA